MKRTLFTLLAFCLCISGLFAQSKIDPELQEEMNRRGNDDKIKVCVMMREQSDATALTRDANRFAKAQERREYVVATLQRQAEASQADLMGLLAEMESNGMVDDINSLWIVNAVTCNANKAAIESLALRGDIQTVMFRKERQWISDTEATAVPRNQNRDVAQNLLQVNAPQVWEQGYTGEGVIVAIIDTGVNYNHVDLQGRLWDGGPQYPHHGYDFYNHDNDPMDDNGHGTHVAGTICGTGTAGTQTGIAPGATLMILKGLTADGSGEETQWIEAIQFALEHGAQVISMSLGRPGAAANYKLMDRRACDNTLAAGVAIAVCAGNMRMFEMWAPVPHNIWSPGDCPPPMLHEDQLVNPGGTSCVISVGGVDYNDSIGYFSSKGPVLWTDVAEYNDYPYTEGSEKEIGLIRPDICAPGVAIVSLDFNTTDGYTEMDGTSMATPLVSGTIALMLSKDPELTPAQIDSILEATAMPLSEHKSNDFGTGRLDALAAVNAVGYDAVSETETVEAKVYPNPSNGIFTVVCEDMKRVEVFSVDGRLVKCLEIRGNEIQIEGLESGVYLLKIMTPKGMMTTKIVKL